MISKAEATELIDDLFEEEAFVIGGLAAIHEMDDNLVRRLMRSLEVIRGKALRRLGDGTPGGGGVAKRSRERVKPHPAIEEFLRSLRRA